MPHKVNTNNISQKKKPLVHPLVFLVAVFSGKVRQFSYLLVLVDDSYRPPSSVTPPSTPDI